MITIKDLKKTFGKLEVLKSISLSFEQPGITAILGPNGSGKTTLIKSILGMVLPDGGKIEFLNQDIKGRYEYRRQIDYLPQIARFPENLRVKELLHMIHDLRGGETRATELIELFRLQPFLDQSLGTLSGGTRQKVNIVQSLMYNSPLLILDEPTNGLDPVALLQLKRLLNEEKQKGKHILITTHIMSFVEEMADDIVFLLEGHIHYRGSKEKLKEEYNADGLEQAIANILQSREISFRANGHSERSAKLGLTN